MVETYVSGYDKKPYDFQALSHDEVKALRYGDHISLIDKSGHMRTVKINGEVKTWKREPLRLKIPYKYGLYEFGYIESDATGRISPLPYRIVT